MKTASYLFFVCLMVGCAKNTQKASNEALDTVFAPLFEFQYASMRAKLRYKRDNAQQSATIDIRMLRDSVIWASIRKVGIEPFRVLARPDSVFIMDRFDKEVVEYSMDDFRLKSGLSLSLSELQDVLFGRSPFINMKKRKMIRGIDEVEVRTALKKTTVSHFIPVSSYLVERIQIEAPDTKAKLYFSEYQEIEDIFIPFTIRGEMQAAKNNSSTEVELDYSSVRIDEEVLSFPFTIGDRYTRVRAKLK